MDTTATADLLIGMPAIAAYLGVSTRQAGYYHEKKLLPTFKPKGIGRVCARRTAIDKWVAELEHSDDQPERDGEANADA